VPRAYVLTLNIHNRQTTITASDINNMVYLTHD